MRNTRIWSGLRIVYNAYPHVWGLAADHAGMQTSFLDRMVVHRDNHGGHNIKALPVIGKIFGHVRMPPHLREVGPSRAVGCFGQGRQPLDLREARSLIGQARPSSLPPCFAGGITFALDLSQAFECLRYGFQTRNH